MGSPSAQLAPGFLIASPPLGDPNFDRTVVLLALHGAEGALGFVVNRPAPMSLPEFFGYAGYGKIGASDPTHVLVGGPVQPTSGWILCLDPGLAREDGVITVGDRVRITSSRSAFDALARDVGARAPGEGDPKRRSVLLGYSGWGPGQLEGEIAAGAWLPVPLDETVLFDVAIDERWERAYALLGLTPAGVISMRSGGAA
ncbi:MAG TPA: YqgE/AlgH family protein [Minicystis sp.]|nr:YqgE/AlgH family protein [Minicystis sp.]